MELIKGHAVRCCSVKVNEVRSDGLHHSDDTSKKKHPLTGVLMPKIWPVQQEGLEGKRGNTVKVQCS